MLLFLAFMGVLAWLDSRGSDAYAYWLCDQIEQSLEAQRQANEKVDRIAVVFDEVYQRTLLEAKASPDQQTQEKHI